MGSANFATHPVGRTSLRPRRVSPSSVAHAPLTWIDTLPQQSDQLDLGVDAELSEHGGQVVAHRARAQKHGFGNLWSAFAGQEPRNYLALARRRTLEPVEGLVVATTYRDTYESDPLGEVWLPVEMGASEDTRRRALMDFVGQTGQETSDTGLHGEGT